MILPNVPYTSPGVQSLSSLGVGFIGLEPLELSHSYNRPHVGSNINGAMPSTGELQSPGCSSTEALMMPPMPQLLPPQHVQVVDGIDDHRQQLQHAVDMTVSWAFFDPSMAQPFQASSINNSAMHQVESGDCVFWNWELPNTETHAENEWESFLTHP